MSQARRAATARMPRITTSEPGPPPPERKPEPAERVVVVDALDAAWRVSAAHMEPLRFRSPADAEKAGHRVAQNLTRLGFDARVEIYDAAGALTAAKPYPARAGGPPKAPRRQLDS
jgi:hypothetical protein